jgi:hypothetical protein
MAMANKVKLNNGDEFRVVQGKGMFETSWMIQAKESSKGKSRWYNIGRREELSDAIAEMNRRAEIVNVKGFC